MSENTVDGNLLAGADNKRTVGASFGAGDGITAAWVSADDLSRPVQHVSKLAPYDSARVTIPHNHSTSFGAVGTISAMAVTVGGEPGTISFHHANRTDEDGHSITFWANLDVIGVFTFTRGGFAFEGDAEACAQAFRDLLLSLK